MSVGRNPFSLTVRRLGAVVLLSAGLAACGDGENRAGDCVGGCDGNGGPALFGPADPGDWVSFRNGPERQGVARGGVLGRDVRVAWSRPDFLVLEYSAVKPSGAVWGDDLFYPSDDGSLWGFDRHTGDVLWSEHLSDHRNGIHGSPVASKSVVWIGTYAGNVHAMDRATGEEVYRFFPGRWIGSSPIYVEPHHAVYTSHETWANDHPAGLITKNDPHSGDEIWSSEVIGHYTHSSVAVDVAGDRVFVGANDGSMRAYDADTGERLWRRDFESEGSGEADIKTTPAVSPSRGLVVFGTWDRRVYALDVATGETRWSVDTGGLLMGSAAIHEETGRVYVGTQRVRDGLLALDLDTGEVEWRVDTGSWVASSPAVNDDGTGLVVGSSDGRVWGIEADTGAVRWTFQADGEVTASPAWVGRNIYFAAKQGSLYALETLD